MTRINANLLCVADFGTWKSGRFTFIRSQSGLEGAPQSIYVRHTPSHQAQYDHFTPIGTLISSLSRRLAWEYPALRDLVDYYYVTQIGGNGKGSFRQWPISIYSENVRRGIRDGVGGSSSNIRTWNEWNVAFNLQ